MIKLFILKNKTMYLSRVTEETDCYWSLQNPMLVDYEISLDMKTSFKYLPWQIISEDSAVELNKQDIVFVTSPKVEMLNIYEQINQTF